MKTISEIKTRWVSGVPQVLCEVCQEWLPADDFARAGRVCKVCTEIERLYGQCNTENILSITQLPAPPDKEAFRKVIAQIAGRHIVLSLQSKKTYSYLAWNKLSSKKLLKQFCDDTFKHSDHLRRSFCALICTDKLTPEQTLWLCFKENAVFMQAQFSEITHKCLETIVIEAELSGVYKDIFDVLDNPTKQAIYAVNQVVSQGYHSEKVKLAAQALVALSLEDTGAHAVALFAASSLVMVCASMAPLINVLRAVGDKQIREHEDALKRVRQQWQDHLEH